MTPMDEDAASEARRTTPASAAKWYDLFSRGARDWLRHDEKVREAVRDQSAADHRRRRCHQRRRAHRAGAGAHARALPLPAAPPRGATGRRPGQGQARRRVLRSRRTSEGPGEKGAGRAATTARCSCCSSSRSTTSSTGCGRRCSCRTSRRASALPMSRDWVREGWDRRGARSRLDRRRSFKEMVKRRGHPGATPTFIDEDLRFRQLTRRQPAGDARGGVLPARCLRQHVRPRPEARQDLLLLGGAGTAARVPLARDRVRGAHHRGVGIQRAGLLPGERHRRHGRLDRASQGARDHRRALQPRRAATSICSTPPTATTR